MAKPISNNLRGTMRHELSMALARLRFAAPQCPLTVQRIYEASWPNDEDRQTMDRLRGRYPSFFRSYSYDHQEMMVFRPHGTLVLTLPDRILHIVDDSLPLLTDEERTDFARWIPRAKKVDANIQQMDWAGIAAIDTCKTKGQLASYMPSLVPLLGVDTNEFMEDRPQREPEESLATELEEIRDRLAPYRRIFDTLTLLPKADKKLPDIWVQ